MIRGATIVDGYRYVEPTPTVVASAVAALVRL